MPDVLDSLVTIMAPAGQSGVLSGVCVLVQFYCVLAQLSGSDDWRNSSKSFNGASLI